MGYPLIVPQRPPADARIEPTGLYVPRRWSVMAGSDIKALMIMQYQYGVFRGAVFRDIDGSIPNAYCICQRITAVGKPPAIGRGLGQYIVDALFSTDQQSPRAVPGGPTYWTVRASMTSTAITRDIHNDPILSSSSEPPDEPVTVLRPEEVLHGEFYVQAGDSLNAYRVFRPFQATINAQAAPILGAGMHCLLCYPFTVEPTDTGWVKMTVDIQYRPPWTDFQTGKIYGGWDGYITDKGTREIVDTSSSDPSQAFATIVEKKTGLPARYAYPLDGFGKAQSADALPTLLQKDVYFESDFTKIPFP